MTPVPLIDRGSKWTILVEASLQRCKQPGGGFCVPGRQLQSQVRCDGPGQVDVVLPLLLRHAAVLGPPVCDAGLQRRLRGDGELRSGQRVVPYGQPLDLVGLRRDKQGEGLKFDGIGVPTLAFKPGVGTREAELRM